MSINSVKRCLLLTIFFSIFWSKSFAFFADTEVWEQDNQYVELVPWDVSRSARNDHPVELELKQLAVTLHYLKAKVEKSNKIRRIFSKSQAEQLASHIIDGLSKSNKKVDLVFVVNDLLDKEKFITARVFYVDGRLNLIFGSREGKPGLRARAASDALQIVAQPGIAYRGDREDWLTLHSEKIAGNLEIEALKAAAKNSTPPKDKPSVEKTSQEKTETVRKPSSEELRKARELKLENARLKKKLRGQQKNMSEPKLSMEERLAKLKKLYEKELITEDEYETKRTSILGEL